MPQLADSESSERLAGGSLPWRGPGPGMPDLPLPPARMPLRRHGNLRKRWRYVGVYGPEVMLCAARAQVGPFTQCFWSLWDREAKDLHGATRIRPGSHEVSFSGDTITFGSGGVHAQLTLHPGPEPVEVICRSGERGYGWTRKLAGLNVTGTATANGKTWGLSGSRGVDDTSAGYHDRHILWHWSAGVGESVDGLALGWNLVTGINDPAANSERTVWLEGAATETGPVVFDGLTSIGFEDESRMSFHSEAERARDENMLLVRSNYRHRFGTFSGELAGVEIGEAFGVMEEHEAHW